MYARIGMLALTMALVAGPQTTADATAPGTAQVTTDEIRELLVLLAAGEGVPSPEDVVDAASRGEPLPGTLGEGNPETVELVITHRAAGLARQWLLDNPDSPRARLERYLLMVYPAETDLDPLIPVLIADPNVLHAEKNLRFELHVATAPRATDVITSDPLLPIATQPGDYQWGSHLLRLPEAWDHTKGTGYVALLDNGLQVDHPDLRPFHEEGGKLVFSGGN
ncbi:MAG: hypothetical protein GY856_08505, partial [bacterium]|nr:hypothetical protein [bacterium]